MEIIEEEFTDLRNWKEEVLNLYQIFQSVYEVPAEILFLNPATYEVMRQLASQNQQSVSWVPEIDQTANPPGIVFGSDANLRIQLSNAVPLSAFQVGVSVKIHS